MYFDAILGVVKLLIYKIFKYKNIYFSPKIRFSRTARLRLRKNSKLVLGTKVGVSPGVILAVTKNAFLSIGNNSGLNYNTVIVSRYKIIIGNNVLIGPNVVIYDHDHIFNKETLIKDSGYKLSSIHIEDNVWIGANSIILKGVTIGKGSVISAGCTITEDVPPYHLVLGNRELKKIRIEKHK